MTIWASAEPAPAARRRRRRAAQAQGVHALAEQREHRGVANSAAAGGEQRRRRPRPRPSSTGSAAAARSSRPTAAATVSPLKKIARPAVSTVRRCASQPGPGARELLAVARDEQQAVVHRQAEPERRRDVEREDRDLGELAQHAQREEGADDGDRRRSAAAATRRPARGTRAGAGSPGSGTRSARRACRSSRTVSFTSLKPTAKPPTVTSSSSEWSVGGIRFAASSRSPSSVCAKWPRISAELPSRETSSRPSRGSERSHAPPPPRGRSRQPCARRWISAAGRRRCDVAPRRARRRRPARAQGRGRAPAPPARRRARSPTPDR